MTVLSVVRGCVQLFSSQPASPRILLPAGCRTICKRRLKTAECCGGGLQDFVGQHGVVDRPREDQGSDKTRHCRQRLFPPRGRRSSGHEPAESFNQGLEAFRNGTPYGPRLAHNIRPDRGDKATARSVTAMLRREVAPYDRLK